MPPRSLLTLLLATGPTVLAAAPASFTDCAAIEDSDDRLLCYDRVAGRYEPAAEPVLPGPPPPQPPRDLPVLAEPKPAERASPFSVRWQTDAADIDDIFVITPYKPNYILPVTYATDLNDKVYPESEQGLVEDKLEAKFQISFKAKLWDGLYQDYGDIWFAYTQQAWWQVYNDEQSAPFRETNYEPELILGLATDLSALGWHWRYVNVGFNHQSNGRSDPLSRSWNRAILGTAFERGDDLALLARYWWRLPEDEEDDNNPDIEEFIGKGELWAFYRNDNQSWAAMIRNNFDLDDNRGAFELDWSFPLFGSVKGYLQYFYGYGESLIEYDQKHHRIGLGLLLSDWL